MQIAVSIELIYGEDVHEPYILGRIHVFHWATKTEFSMFCACSSEAVTKDHLKLSKITCACRETFFDQTLTVFLYSL